LRQIETEIGAIEEGKRQSLSGQFPTELQGVARNMNLLIDSERARSDRYKATLDNLAHSLKTPLAAMRALLNQGLSTKFSDRFDEQIERMDEIVRYQLRKPATLATENIVLTQLSVAKEVDRLVDGLRKVYHDKEPEIETALEDGIQFRGDKGDFLAGVKGGIVLSVADDGPGIPAVAVEALLQRGTRLDESTPGHGIGLAVVKDIAHSYGGQLSIQSSDLGGAEITVTISPSTT
jgi:two-component system sensor histidine kinase PhoQ